MVDGIKIPTHEEEAHATFASAICSLLKDQAVEIYCGNTSRMLHFAEIEHSLISIIRGVVRAALGDCLVVECTAPNKGKKFLYINAWAIESIMPAGGIMSINDVYNDDISIQEHKRQVPRGI